MLPKGNRWIQYVFKVCFIPKKQIDFKSKHEEITRSSNLRNICIIKSVNWCEYRLREAENESKTYYGDYVCMTVMLGIYQGISLYTDVGNWSVLSYFMRHIL